MRSAVLTTDVGSRFAVGGARMEAAVARVIDVLDNARLTEPDVRRRAGGNQSLIGRALREARRRGLIERDGPGHRGWPYSYAVALVDADAVRDFRAAWTELGADDRARLRAEANAGDDGDFVCDLVRKYLRAIEASERADAILFGASMLGTARRTEGDRPEASPPR